MNLKQQMYDTMLGDKFRGKLNLSTLIDMNHIMDDYDFNPIEKDKKRMRMTKECALSLIEGYGDHAHFMALEELEKNPNNQLWRDVLSWLDDLSKQNGEKK